MVFMIKISQFYSTIDCVFLSMCMCLCRGVTGDSGGVGGAARHPERDAGARGAGLPLHARARGAGGRRAQVVRITPHHQLLSNTLPVQVPQLPHCPHLPVDPALAPPGPRLAAAQAQPRPRGHGRPVQQTQGALHQVRHS